MRKQIYKCKTIHFKEGSIIEDCEFIILEPFIIIIQNEGCNWYALGDVHTIENVTPIENPQRGKALFL